MPEVNLDAYVGREQAYVKHCLLEQYLPDWCYKVGRDWGSVVYIDGFSGPWEVKDSAFADSSFGIASRVLKKARLGLRDKWNKRLKVRCILVEKEEEPFLRPSSFAAQASEEDFEVKALKGEFGKNVSEIIRLADASSTKPFRFVFIDPKGWGDIPMSELKPLLQNRSCEVLINLMTGPMMRFLDLEDRKESYQRLYGRDDALLEIQKLPKGSPERMERAVREYCRSLRDICGFEYVSEAVILEPQEERIRYFLLFATNHPRGVEVFKDAEMKAARIQDEVRHEVRSKGDQELDLGLGPVKSRIVHDLRDRYLNRAKRQVLKKLLSFADNCFIPYNALFCEAMAFPLVTPQDLIRWLRTGFNQTIGFRLEGESQTRNLNPSKNDLVVIRDRAYLEDVLGRLS